LEIIIIIPFAKAPGVGGTPTPVYLSRSSGLSSETLGRITNSVFMILGEGRKEMGGWLELQIPITRRTRPQKTSSILLRLAQSHVFKFHEVLH